MLSGNDRSRSECTKIAHRQQFFSTGTGITMNFLSADHDIFPDQRHRNNRHSLAIFRHREIAHPGASKTLNFSRSRKITAAEVRASLVHSGYDPHRTDPSRGLPNVEFEDQHHWSFGGSFPWQDENGTASETTRPGTSAP